MYTNSSTKENKQQCEAPFKFSPENMTKVQYHIAKYPVGRQASAVLPLLHLAQRQNGGWLSVSALEEVANILDMAYIRVYEVVTFYKMFFLAPTGKFNLQFCGTTPCWLRGAAQLKEACQRRLKIDTGDVTSDGVFSIVEVECVGACTHAPVIQINDELFENLSENQLMSILDDLEKGETVDSLFNRYTPKSIVNESLDISTPKTSTKKTRAKKSVTQSEMDAESMVGDSNNAK